MKKTDIVSEDGATKVAIWIKENLAEITLQDAASAYKDLLRGTELRRRAGEGIKTRTERFMQVFTKAGRKVHAACPEIPASTFSSRA